jgi:hypothetical protein
VPKTDFPKEYLEGLEKNHKEKVDRTLDTAEKLLMYSGARLNWVGEYINDESVKWELKTLPVDSLTLTGTGPAWNEIIINRAEAKPSKLRELLKDPKISKMFENSSYIDIPILVRKEGEKLKILDGMNRTIAAVRDNIKEISAYVGTRLGNPQPTIEPHVVYDFIRAYYQRGGDEDDFKGGLRYLLSSYANVKDLLKTRFNSTWVRDEKVQLLIKEVLTS